MDGLIKTKFEEMKFGDIFYKKQGSYFHGPFLHIGFQLDKRTRRLPTGAKIVLNYYYGPNVLCILGLGLSSRRISTIWRYDELYVDPTASILVQGLPVGEREDDVPF
jgi:hypothetical protein